MQKQKNYIMTKKLLLIIVAIFSLNILFAKTDKGIYSSYLIQQSNSSTETDFFFRPSDEEASKMHYRNAKNFNNKRKKGINYNPNSELIGTNTFENPFNSTVQTNYNLSYGSYTTGEIEVPFNENDYNYGFPEDPDVIPDPELVPLDDFDTLFILIFASLLCTVIIKSRTK